MNKKITIVLILLSICLSSVLGARNTSAASALNLKSGCWTQGATMLKNSFIYTEWCGDGKETTIYKCERSDTKVSNCKKVIKGVFNHANVIDSEWNSSYVRILDSGMSQKKGHAHWCVSIAQKTIVDDSLCGSLPDFKVRKNQDSTTNQGYAQYGEYYVRGYAFKNRIDIWKGNKLVKTLWVGHDDEELEDVAVDGDTGTIYFTTGSRTNGRQIKLYKISSKVYKLPKYFKLTKNSTGANSNTNTGSGTGTGGSSTSANANVNTSTTTSAGSQTQDRCASMPASVAAVYGCAANTNAGTSDNLQSVIITIINSIVSVLSLVAVVFVVVGGVNYMTSAGNVGKIEKAKKTILYAAIGLIICVLAFAITNFVIGLL